MSDSWPSSIGDEPSDSISARAVEIERALRTLEAVEAFRTEAAALRAELQAARAPLGRRPARRARTPDLPEGTWRLIGEAALIVAVAVAVWAADLQRRDIVLTMVGAWIFVALVEAVASRRSELRWSPPPPPPVAQPVVAAPPSEPPPPQPVPVAPEPAWPARPEVGDAYGDPEPVTIVQPLPAAVPEPAAEPPVPDSGPLEGVPGEPVPSPAADAGPDLELVEEPVAEEELVPAEEPVAVPPPRRRFWSRSGQVAPAPALEQEPEPGPTVRDSGPAEGVPGEPVGSSAAAAVPEAANSWPDDVDDGHLVGAVAALEEAAARLEAAVMATPEVRRRWRLRRRRMRSRV